MKKPNFFKWFFVYIIIFIFIYFSLNFYSQAGKIGMQLQNYTYSNLVDDIKNNNTNNIKDIEIYLNQESFDNGYVKVDFKNGIVTKVEIPSISSFMNLIHSYDNAKNLIITKKPRVTSSLFSNIIPLILGIFLIAIVVGIFNQKNRGDGSSSGGGPIGGRMSGFGKSRAKVLTENQKVATFKDVAGLKEEKEDLEEIVEFLKCPQKFREIGARIPKGILLVGPPGTGKTLLARAIAGEAGVKFFSISGSDFVEMFVGVGASRVRDMFEEAKKNKPCLIFIDEIDAVGRKRGSGLGGGHDEREQTLNQLLVEMDGFSPNENIIIIAATNRVDILDPALLRPGRFDRQIYVGAPDVKGRKEILEVHARTRKLSTDVDLEEVAKITAGFTGAELENLLNESAIIATKKEKSFIEIDDIRKALIKVSIGAEKKSRVISNEEKKITAYHEAGHAIVGEMLPLVDKVHLISIIPTGGAGGYTLNLPVDKGYLSKNYLLQEIMVFFGGRIAEDLIFGDITTGASNDIERATNIALGMVVKYGMSSLGPIDFNKEKISQDLSNSIDSEVNKIITKCYDDAKKILEENIEYLHKVANLLLEKEKVTSEEFLALFPEGFFPEKVMPTYTNKNI